MTTFQAFILGIVQGLTELLPISSSAHLNLIPWAFGWTIPDSFDVALHFGTLLSIVLYFYKDWIELIKEGLQIFATNGGSTHWLKGTFRDMSQKARMFWYIACATIPGGIIGFLLDHFLEDKLKTPIIMAVALIIMGIILYIVDKTKKSTVKYEKMTLKQTFLIGLSQALAFIPGVSRSGITITTARMLNVDRASAARFSFMLSAPIVLAATIFKLKDFIFSLPFFIGVLVSFIVGLFVIKFLLKYLQKGSFKVFAIYRVIFGIIVIILYCVR